MDSLAHLLIVALGVYFISFVLLIVAAFKVRPYWGLYALLCLIFFPPAVLAFAIVHWNNGGKRILGMAVGLLAIVTIVTTEFVTDPQLSTPFWRGFADAMERKGVHLPARPGVHDRKVAQGPRDPNKPHEAHDVAENETAPAPVPAATVDPHAAERGALVRHSAELNTLYAELNKERATLKKGSPEVAAFNAKAAKYQEGIKSLTAEQAQLNVLDHPAAAAAKPR